MARFKAKEKTIYRYALHCNFSSYCRSNNCNIPINRNKWHQQLLLLHMADNVNGQTDNQEEGKKRST